MYEIEFDKNQALYTTSVVAKMLKVTPDRLRSYDKDLKMITQREETGQVSRRLYSQNDIEWLLAIRELIKVHNMSINSIKAIIVLLYLNPKITFPESELGKVYKVLQDNPNLNKLAKKY